MKKCTSSKYFKSNENEINNFENVAVNNENGNSSVESPYKNILNNIKVNLDSSNEANDFKTPKHFTSQKTILPKAHHNTKPLVKRKKRTKKKLQLNGQPRINSFVNNVDTNPEHLQMAVALSRSLQKETLPDDLENGTVSNKLSMLGLEQFMYKPSNSKLLVGNRQVGADRRRDRARSRYITPVLMIRTQEERQEMIATKISELLLHNIPPAQSFYESITPISGSLESYFNSNQSLFKKSGNARDIPVGDFYVKSLNLDQNVTQCGTLLKDWHKIPGRSVSPVDFCNSPSKSSSCVTKNCSEVKEATQTCYSPELFDSDDDNLYIATKNSDMYKNVKNRSRNEDCNLKDSSNESSESLLNLTPRKSKILKDKEISSFLCGDLRQKDYFDDESNSNGTSKDRVSEILGNSIDLNQHRSKDSKLSDEDYYVDLTQSSNSEGKEDGNLKTGISEIFKNEMSVNENESLRDAGMTNLNVDNFRNKTFQWPQDTFDELFDNEINLSIFNEKVNMRDNPPAISQSKHSFNSTKSEASIVISDDELNYSCNYGRPDSSFKARSLSPEPSFESASFCSDLDRISPDSNALQLKEMDENKGITFTQDNGMNDTILYSLHDVPSSPNEKRPSTTTAHENTSTPKSEVIIKTTNVTPSTNYDEMNTPKIERELEKFGIKPLKRKQGIKLLNYIYNSTHPVLNHTDAIKENLEDSITKRRKINPTFQGENKKETNVTKLVDNALGEHEELIFEKTQSKRVASCRIPLHIVWYNLVASDPNLHKSIVLYEPLHLEFLYKTIRKHGYKFHVEDLMRFLDKKCITIRTEQHSRHKQKNCKRKSE